jgi:sugar phosphate isomerase/epimerase
MDNVNPHSRREFLAAAAASGVALLAASCSSVAGGGRAARPRWRIGCYTRPWDEHPIEVALDAIAEAGYRYVGIMTAKGKSWVVITPETTPAEARRVGDAVRQRGLKTISVYGDFSVAESSGIEALRRIIDHTAACESPDLLLGGVGDAKLYDAYFRAIAQCCDYARSQGVRLTIKPHGGLNATGPQCRNAIERVNHPNFKLWYDPGNILYYSEGALDPVPDAATVGDLVVGMSVKDFKPPKEVMITPGTGRVDFPAVFDHLKRRGFKRGSLVVECLERGDVRHITAEARKTRLFIERLTGQRA